MYTPKTLLKSGQGKNKHWFFPATTLLRLVATTCLQFLFNCHKHSDCSLSVVRGDVNNGGRLEPRPHVVIFPWCKWRFYYVLRWILQQSIVLTTYTLIQTYLPKQLSHCPLRQKQHQALGVQQVTANTVFTMQNKDRHFMVWRQLWLIRCKELYLKPPSIYCLFHNTKGEVHVCELIQNLTKTFHGIRGFIDHSECTKEGRGEGVLVERKSG